MTEEDLQKAIETAELDDFIKTLPQGLDTIVSERGSSLSGGQKQRIMLARALAINPKILLLDDFTARVDTLTEEKISENVKRNYLGFNAGFCYTKNRSCKRLRPDHCVDGRRIDRERKT